MIEPFSVDTDDSTLGDESMRVSFLDKTKYARRLATFSQNKKHMNLLSGKEPRAVNNGHTALDLLIDKLPNDFMLIADDEELD